MLTVTIPFPHCASNSPRSTESSLLTRRSRAKRVKFEIDAKEGTSPRAGLPQAALDRLSVTSLVFEGGSSSPRRCNSHGGLSQTALDTLSVPESEWSSAQMSAVGVTAWSPRGLAQSALDALITEEGLPQDILDALCISDGGTFDTR